VNKNKKEIDQLLTQLIQASEHQDEERRKTDESFKLAGGQGWHTHHLKLLERLMRDEY